MVDIKLKVPAIEKLIDYGASGVGAIAGPLLAPWKASREGKARLESARTDAEVRRIDAESEATALSIIAKARSEAQEYLLPSDAEINATVAITKDDIAQSFEFQGRKRLANARVVLEGAADELGDKEVNDHDPDPDWTARFFDYVQDVSSGDMHKIWAKILAGEVESPGRTSLRTLETLRNMTKRDAEMFRDICPLIIGDESVFYDDSVEDFSVLALNNLLHLQDCGLISLGGDLEGLRLWGEENYLVLHHLNGALIVTSNVSPVEPLSIPVLRLTSSGKELGRLSHCVLNMGYLQALSNYLESKDCRLEYISDVVHLPDGSLQFSDRIPIVTDSAEIEVST